MTTRKLKHLYIPIEIKVREFDAKVLFALIAAEQGYRVIIGGQSDLRTRVVWWPQGIYLDKSAAATKVKWFQYFKEIGHKVVGWDEEGLIIHADTYLDRRFSGRSFALMDTFFAWGEYQANLILNKYPNAIDKVAVVGNPRMDMLRPELRKIYFTEKQRINEQYGKIILVNTNFSFHNHIVNRDAGKKAFLRNNPEMDEIFIDGWMRHQKTVFDAFVEMLPLLHEAYPSHTIVVRPHPAENHEAWQEISKKYDRVQVVHKNNVIEWILAADVVIHSNCTTGVEAYLTDVPVIAYRPVISEKFETYLPNLLSDCVTDEQELLNVLQVWLSKDLKDEDKEKDTLKFSEAKKHIEAIDGRFACENVLEHLSRMDVKTVTFELSLSEKMTRAFKELWPMSKRYLNAFKDSLLPSLRQRVIDTYPRSVGEAKSKIHQQTIPEIQGKEVLDCIEEFRAVMNRFDSIKVQDLGKGCFEILKK